jgi:cobalt-precorrin 5A hydrolase
MAAGIVVRAIAPYLENKKTDPAVVVVDDTGFFAISLLSGHMGGANELAEKIAAYLGAIPVITTSTDRHYIPAFDLLARRGKWVMEHAEDLKRISAAQIAGKEILIYAAGNIQVKLPGKYAVVNSEREFQKLLGISQAGNRTSSHAARPGDGPSRSCEGVVLISNRVRLPMVPPGVPFIVLRPRNITAGIGCRRGIPAENIIKAVQDAFGRCRRRIESLQGLATVVNKGQEAGLQEAAKFFHVPLQVIAREEIQAVEQLFSPSLFVKEKIGVASVAEPCAFLGSASGELILRKTKYPGITVALGESSLQLF